MEGSILAQQNHQGVSAPMSKSSRSLIDIDAISIDLVNGKEKSEVGSCDHFSIRGYVAEVRNKDRKKCFPFAADGNPKKSEEEIFTLPPLQATKFRWWHCQRCLSDIDGKGTAKESRKVPNCTNKGLKFNSGSSHVSSYKEAATLPSNFQQASTLNKLGGSKADANTSASVNSDENGVPSCCDKKEKGAEAAHTTVTGQDSISKDNASKELPRTTCDATTFNPCLMLKRHTDDNETAAPKLKCNGFAETFKSNCGINEVNDDRLDTELNCQIRKDIFVDDQKEEMTACGTPGAAGMVQELVIAAKGQACEHPSLELDADDYACSEGDEAPCENNLQHLHFDGSNHRLKPRKVRLLAELLVAEGNGNADQDMVEVAPPNASAMVDSLCVSQGQVAIQGITERGIKGKNKKRKMPCDGDWKPPEITPRNNENKKSRIFKGDMEKVAMAMTKFKSDKDTSAGIGSEAGKKNHRGRNGVERNPILKKKINKDQCGDGRPFLLPFQEALPRENRTKIEDADKRSIADASLTHHAFSSGRVMDPLIKSFLPVQQAQRKSSLCKKKNKMPQVQSMQASLMPWNMLRESSIARQNVETMQSGAEAVHFQTKQNASPGKGPRLSHGNHLAAQENNRKCIRHVEDGPDSFLPQQDIIFRQNQAMRKVVGSTYFGESSMPFKSAADAIIEKNVRWDLDINAVPPGASPMSEKLNCPPLFEDGDLSMVQKMDSCGKSNDVKTVVQKHPEVIKKHGDQRVGKVFEQGALDDIPMEIVELLAKNQYERRRHHAEENVSLLEKTYKPSSEVRIDLNRAHPNGESNLLQEENAHLPISQSSNTQKNIFARGESLGPTYYPRVSLLEGNHTPTGFEAFSQRQQKQSRAVQFPAAGSSRDGTVPNCKWDARMYGHASFPASLQAFKAYDPCHVFPPQSGKAASVWSSMIQNHMPNGRHIPQNCTAQSINMDVLSQCPGTLQKGKMNGNHDLKNLNLNVASIEKQKKNGSSETSNKTNGEYSYACSHKGAEFSAKPLGSVDIYSNETIPAMHLLSLMDAGLQSSTPFNTKENSKFIKRPSFSHDYQSKEFSGLNNGVYKNNHASGHQSSEYYRKNHLPDKSCECFSALPMFGTFAAPLQSDTNVRKATGIPGHVPVKFLEKGEAKKSSHSPTRNRGPKSLKSFSTGVCGANGESISVHSKGKKLLRASDLIVCRSQSHTTEDSMKCNKLDNHSSYGSKTSPETGFCSVNRNPADFSLPVAGNIYMIGAEDLKFRKTSYADKRSGLIRGNLQKKQRTTKPPAKERARHQIS